jgi:integrase/recombinase XerC/integrase/recombinase XerD
VNEVLVSGDSSGASMLQAFAAFLYIDVANGDAREDTIRSYQSNVRAWVNWCQANGINPAKASVDTIKQYRKHLVESGLKAGTIALKLTVIRRFYQAAVERGLVSVNPALHVKAPRDRSAKDASTKYLTAGELELLLRSIPKTGKVKDLRDMAMIRLMALEGLRDVEIMRANVSDIEPERILVRGKGKDAYIYPRRDTLAAIMAYLAARKQAKADDMGEPLFTAVGNRAGGARISRDGIRTVVDAHLSKLGLKRQGLSCHALRHTCGTLLYQETKDLALVQETLRHSNPATTSRYVHIVNRAQVRATEAIQISV